MADRPNPTEAQTSEYRFQQFLAEMRRDDTVKWPPSVAFPYMNKAFNAAWDSRQPEIDRLRAALERIAPQHIATASLTDIAMDREPVHEPNCPGCIAREALDG